MTLTYATALPLISQRLDQYRADAAGRRTVSLTAAPPASPYILGKGLTESHGEDVAALKLQVADDHVQAIGRWLAGPLLLNYSFFTLLRGALESSAWACWLLDPAVPRKTRLERHFTLRLHQQWAQGRFGGTVSADAKKRLTEIASDATTLGLVPVQEKKSAQTVIVGFGTKRPGVTQLLKDLLPDVMPASGMPLGELLYHLLSGKAHGETWANVLGAEVIPADGAGDPFLKTEFPAETGILALEHVLLLHSRATRAYCEVMGGDLAAWDAESTSRLPVAKGLWEMPPPATP
jgi:hypothetical protein